MYRFYAVLLIASMFVLGGCVTPPPPPTYVETAQPVWKTISIRNDLDYDKAWDLLAERIRGNYDIETIDKKSGRITTDWIFTTDGSDYKVQITFKFSSDKKNLKLKADSLYHKVYKGTITGTVYDDYGWLPGSDTKVLNDVYGDISALLG